MFKSTEDKVKDLLSLTSQLRQKMIASEAQRMAEQIAQQQKAMRQEDLNRINKLYKDHLRIIHTPQNIRESENNVIPSSASNSYSTKETYLSSPANFNDAETAISDEQSEQSSEYPFDTTKINAIIQKYHFSAVQENQQRIRLYAPLPSAPTTIYLQERQNDFSELVHGISEIKEAKVRFFPQQGFIYLNNSPHVQSWLKDNNIEIKTSDKSLSK